MRKYCTHTHTVIKWHTHTQRKKSKPTFWFICSWFLYESFTFLLAGRPKVWNVSKKPVDKIERHILWLFRLLSCQDELCHEWIGWINMHSEPVYLTECPCSTELVKFIGVLRTSRGVAGRRRYLEASFDGFAQSTEEDPWRCLCLNLSCCSAVVSRGQLFTF